MLHIIQVVMWGAAEMPQLFLDETKARAAYVESVRTHWGQRYLAYCEHHGLDGDCYESARAFLDRIDVSEKCGVNYWSLAAREVGLGTAQGGKGREGFREIAGEVDALKAGLTRLLDDLSGLSDRLARLGASPDEEPAAPAAAPEQTAPSPATAPEPEPEADPATRATPEWKVLVTTLKRLGSGSRNDFHLLSRDDWRQDVYSSRTSLEYWDWVADRIGTLRERAENASYAVVVDPDAPDCYRFTNPQGIACEDCCGSEWEAWCAAGLDLQAQGRDEQG